MIEYINNNKNNTILFLHGLGCASLYYDKLVNILDNKYNIVLFELSGHEINSNLDFTIEDDAIKIKDFCIEKNIRIDIIVAHSISSVLTFLLDSIVQGIKKIFLLEGNIIEEDFEWSSNLSYMDPNEFESYWKKYVEQYPLILKIKTKNQNNLKKYSENITKLNSLGIYKYAKEIQIYKDKIETFNSSFSKLIYFESENSKLIEDKRVFLNKLGIPLMEVENSSHYMMLDASENIYSYIKKSV